MAEDELFALGVGDVVDRHAAAAGFDIRVEQHLQQHVAQLLAEHGRVVAVERLAGLVGLLKKITADGQVRLRRVPRAAARRAQHMHQPDQVGQVIARFASKIYHTFVSFASRKFMFCV